MTYDRGAYRESYVHSSTGKEGAGGRYQMPEISFQNKRVGYGVEIIIPILKGMYVGLI